MPENGSVRVAIVPVSENYGCVTMCAEAGVRVISCDKPISP